MIDNYNIKDNTFWLIFGKIFSISINLFIFIKIARYLGPEEFGTFSYAYSIFQIMAVCAGLGLQDILVRNLVKNGSVNQLFVGTAFWLRFIFSIFIIILFCLFLFLMNFDHKGMLVIVSLSIIFQSFNVIDSYFQSKVLSKYTVFAFSISLLLSSAIKLIFIFYNLPLIYFGFAILIENALIGFSYFFIYLYKTDKFIKWKLDFDTSKYLLKDSWPIIFAGIGYIIYTKIDQVMIYSMLSKSEAGYYSASVKLIDLLCIFPALLVMSIFPILIRKYNKGDDFEKNILSLYRFFIFYSLILICFIFFLQNNIISFVYGSEFRGPTNIMFLLSFVILFESVAKINGRWIILRNLQIISLYRTFFGVVLNISLNFYFIPNYGIKGAAYSTLITLFFSVFSFYFFFNKSRDITVMQLRSFLTFYKIRDFFKIIR